MKDKLTKFERWKNAIRIRRRKKNKICREEKEKKENEQGKEENQKRKWMRKK